jgi:5-methylcytosine-specific restriction endonuclease McrA
MTTLFDKITCDKCGNWYREDWHHTCEKKDTMTDKEFRIAFEPIIDAIVNLRENYGSWNETQRREKIEGIMKSTLEQRDALRKKLLDSLNLTPEQKKLLNLLRREGSSELATLESSEVSGEGGLSDAEYRQCIICNDYLPLSKANFYTREAGKFRNECIRCWVLRAAARKKSNKVTNDSCLDKKEKKCPGCEQVKEICSHNFWRESGNPDGFSIRCKVCKNLQESADRLRMEFKGLTTSSQFVQKIVERHDYLCAYCQESNYEHLDHLYPINPKPGEIGGDNRSTNIIPACSRCNLSKNNSNPEKWIVSIWGEEHPMLIQVRAIKREYLEGKKARELTVVEAIPEFLDWVEVSTGSSLAEEEALERAVAVSREAEARKAEKVRVVWVEQPRSSKSVWTEILGRAAALLPESEASSEFEAPGELETE